MGNEREKDQTTDGQRAIATVPEDKTMPGQGGKVDVAGETLLNRMFNKLHHKVREAEVVLRHPSVAVEVGGESELAPDNITGSAVRFSQRLELMENATRLGTDRNAFRHALWQAAITSDMGPEIAKEVGDEHELDPGLLDRIPDPNAIRFTGPGALARADDVIDLLNNILGRALGAQHPSAPMNELAREVLEYFRTEGLWVAVQQKPGEYRIEREKLSPELFQKSLALLKQLDAHGHTTAEEAARVAALRRAEAELLDAQGLK
jgi:hypothetical protein